MRLETCLEKPSGSWGDVMAEPCIPGQAASLVASAGQWPCAAAGEKACAALSGPETNIM